MHSAVRSPAPANARKGNDWTPPMRPAAHPLQTAQHSLGNRAFGALLQAPPAPAHEETEAEHAASAVPATPVDVASNAVFDPRPGHDLSGVRLHSGPSAEAAANAAGARAFTVGQDIVLGERPDARLLAHEAAHTVQQRSGQPRLARQPKDKPPDTPATPTDKTAAPSASPDVHFGSPAFPWALFDHLILKLPKRWQDAYDAAKGTGEYILFEPKLGHDLAYRELMAFSNLFHAGVYTGLSGYKPTFGKALDTAEGLSGVTDTYLNLFSLALRLDLKKYLENDLKDAALSNLGWAIIYGLAIQGALVGINAASKDDLDFTSVLGKPLKSFTDAPRGFGRPYAVGNNLDPRWSEYPFGSSPTGIGLKLGGVGDETKPYTFSSNLGFNIASAADLYPKSDADKAKYNGFELYPYFKYTRSWAKTPEPPFDPNAPIPGGNIPPKVTDVWMAGVFFGDRGYYTLLEGGQKRIAPENNVGETYVRTGLAFRDLGPITLLQAGGEFDYRPQDPKVRERINAATTINLVDSQHWKFTVGASLGYLLPKDEAAGAFDYGGQLSMYHKYQRGAGKDPLLTGFDVSGSYRNRDPFVATSPEMFSLKGTITFFDYLKFSLEYHDITGEPLETNLPKQDTRFMIYPGPGIFNF